MGLIKTPFASVKPGDMLITPSGKTTVITTENDRLSINVYTSNGGVIRGKYYDYAWIDEDHDNADFGNENESDVVSSGWAEDGSYTTSSGVTYTAEEMENAAYSGADFST